MPPHVDFECPERFAFAEYSEQLWLSLPVEAQENIVADDIAAKAYIKECEARAEVHNK